MGALENDGRLNRRIEEGFEHKHRHKVSNGGVRNTLDQLHMDSIINQNGLTKKTIQHTKQNTKFQ